MTRTRLLQAVFVVLWLLAGVGIRPAHAQQVFAGDPIDGSTGKAYPMMPGVVLVLAGPDGDLGTSDDVVDGSFIGDVDLVARIGTITQATIPAPAGAAGGPAIATFVAGGGVTGQGAEVPFSILVSDGTGNPPYGNVITATDLDARPVTVFAFADLDGDGVIGPTDADGSADDAIERQEASAYVGRQVGDFASGRLHGSLGIQVAAPATMGGLLVELSAAAYTGSDPAALFADGPAIYTLWPYFPPLDPKRVVGGNAPPPDPNLPSEVKFDITRNYLPALSHPLLGGAFAVPLDGSEPSTDQVRVVSGDAVRVAFFDEVDPTAYRPVSRMWLRPAPDASGIGKRFVLETDSVALAADGSTSQRELRLLPIDLLGNVADPDAAGMNVQLVASGGVRIVAPDADQNPLQEDLLVAFAAGTTVTLDEVGVSGRVEILQGTRILGVLDVAVASAGDSDEDGIADDGNQSGLATDRPCRDSETTGCDDNCRTVINPGQFDEDFNGLGNCCDGVCVAKPDEPGCGQCQEVGVETPAVFENLKIKAKIRDDKPHKVIVRAQLRLAAGGQIDPPNETLSFAIMQADVLRYEVVLDSLLRATAPGSEKFVYKNSIGAVSGVRSTVVKRKRGGAYSLFLRAKADSLLALDLGAAAATVAIGDDGFAQAVTCGAAKGALDCR